MHDNVCHVGSCKCACYIYLRAHVLVCMMRANAVWCTPHVGLSLHVESHPGGIPTVSTCLAQILYQVNLGA